MLKYQLHKLSKGGKEARAVLLEDILTSDVFGLMAYFPYNLLLKPFLEQVRIRNPESNFSAPDVEPISLNFWKSFHWTEGLPQLGRQSIEPDVVIEWSTVLLVIEAKFISPTDPEELLREYLVGVKAARPARNFFLLLIDKNLSPPRLEYSLVPGGITISEYIQKRIRELNLLNEFPSQQVDSSVLWINWQSFYTLVEDLFQKILPNKNTSIDLIHENIFRDLLEVLKRKELTPFEPLSLNDFQEYELNLRSLDEIGHMVQSTFADLSDIEIDIDALGKIGLRINDPVPFLAGLNLQTNDLTALLLSWSMVRR